MSGFRAGSASLDISPPLGLPMLGYVRRWQHGQGYGSPLQVTALALESDELRSVICGVDTVGIQRPEVDRLRERVAHASGAHLEAVLLNWNHTHCAPPGGLSMADLQLGGSSDEEGLHERTASYVATLHEQIVEVARRACERLEPASVAWGVGSAPLNVNRRERAAGGRIILGWRPDGLVDRSVTVLQARRPDGSAIATAVGYGCHTITVGPDVLDYSADFPGPMRDAIRSWTGGEAIFLQGAGGNVLPLVSFAGHAEAERFGTRLALEALHAVADRSSGLRRLVRSADGSATPFSLYRFESSLGEVALEVAETETEFPLLPLPNLAEIAHIEAELNDAYEAAQSARASRPDLNIHLYHLNWARRTRTAIESGNAPMSASGPITALRIGEGAIVTGPGEIFSEIGLAVKERSPARPTLYAGYTNGAISYFPTAAAYPEGGYEPGFGNRTYGLPAQVAPECDRLLVETAVRTLELLFPERAPYSGPTWEATGVQPELPPEPFPEPPA